MVKLSKTSVPVGFGLALVTTLSPHNQLVVEQPTIEFLPDAHAPALAWVERNPRDIAVVVRLGGATTVPPKDIAYWLRRDFEENGGCRTSFLFERGLSDGGSSVTFVTRNHVWGAFSLAASRENVKEACSQHRFEVERGLH